MCQPDDQHPFKLNSTMPVRPLLSMSLRPTRAGFRYPGLIVTALTAMCRSVGPGLFD